jgi:hypothetical protein
MIKKQKVMVNKKEKGSEEKEIKIKEITEETNEFRGYLRRV